MAGVRGAHIEVQPPIPWQRRRASQRQRNVAQRFTPVISSPHAPPPPRRFHRPCRGVDSMPGTDMLKQQNRLQERLKPNPSGPLSAAHHERDSANAATGTRQARLRENPSLKKRQCHQQVQREEYVLESTWRQP